MIPPIQESACHFLFGKEANEVFGKANFSEEFINQSLDTMMRVNIAFLSRKENDGFSLLDPAAFNNQCHLYALFSAKIREHYKSKSLDEKLAKTQENRFLHLSFLLSYAFLNERRLLCDAIQGASNKNEVKLPSDKKRFNDFVKDSNGILIRTARQSLNGVFENCIKDTFEAAKENSLLHRELYHLSLEDLHIPANRGNKNQSENLTLYTLPKLVGVAYLINEKLPIIIKSKVMTSEGVAGMLVYQSAPVKEDESVLVFETITSEEMSISQFEEKAKRCPKYFFRNVSSSNRHDKKGSKESTCSFCTSNDVDLQPHQKSFERATENIEKTLQALGADFVKEVQPSFEQFFQDDSKYPLLTKIFQEAIPTIDEFGLSTKKPAAFTVDHVYVNDARHALQSGLRMDLSPEAYLKMRDFL